MLQLAATGARNRDIADALGISENTVKFHVARKFHVASLLRKGRRPYPHRARLPDTLASLPAGTDGTPRVW